MTNVVTICNQALSHLGSDRLIESISPPDGSVQSRYCATFYGPARMEALEMFAWDFARTRAKLAQLASNPSRVWAFAYALPSDCVRPLRIPPYNSGRQLPLPYDDQDGARIDDNERGSATFQIEGQALLTNEPEAELIYTRDVVDVTRFSPTFATALSYVLAAYLAGPLVRGDSGMRLASELREFARGIAGSAAVVNANASVERQEHTPPWIANR